MNPANPIVATAGRVLLSLLFLMSGISKLAAPAGTKAYIAMSGLPMPDLAYVLAIVVEVGFGAALLIGYRTRLVAGVLAVFTLATAVAFHAAFDDQNQIVHFLKNIAITGGLLQLVAYGAGAFSLDSRFGASAKRLPAATE